MEYTTWNYLWWLYRFSNMNVYYSRYVLCIYVCYVIVQCRLLPTYTYVPLYNRYQKSDMTTMWRAESENEASFVWNVIVVKNNIHFTCKKEDQSTSKFFLTFWCCRNYVGLLIYGIISHISNALMISWKSENFLLECYENFLLYTENEVYLFKHLQDMIVIVLGYYKKLSQTLINT